MVRKHRDNLAGEHDYADAGQLALFILFLSVWASDLFLGYSDFANAHVTLAARLPIGVILVCASAYFIVSGFWALFGRRKSERFEDKGVFALVRHPIYLGEMVFYLGLLVFNISLAATTVWIMGLVFMFYISRFEERLLLQKFGDDYRRYMAKVPMWLLRYKR